MKQETAKKITKKIIAVILNEQNGFSEEEIKKDKLVEDCEGSSLFNRIQSVLENTK